MKKPPLTAFIVLTLLFLFMTATFIAFTQKPWPDPFHSPKYPESLLYPIEFNDLKGAGSVQLNLSLLLLSIRYLMIQVKNKSFFN